MTTYSALLSEETNSTVASKISTIERPKISTDEVLIQASYSSLNYKDALGITGRGKIFKTMPLIGGIDVSGTVIESNSARFKKGDHVLVTGCGLGETHNGGYAQLVKEHAKNVVALPKGLNLREAMIYGTAGFTAALCLERMLQNGQTPEMGPILVTGASGGVGQFAVSLFSTAGFVVHALTGKSGLEKRLENLGAKKVIATDMLKMSDRPLDSVAYGGIVDNVGGKLLAGLIPQVQLWGNIASVGLALGADLQTTVMPFILRGVSILGISSNNTPWPLRLKIWNRLSTDLKPQHLEAFATAEIGLSDLVAAAEKLLARRSHGRTIVRL